MTKLARVDTRLWQLNLSHFPEALRYRVERYKLEWNHTHPGEQLSTRDIVVEALEAWLAEHEAQTVKE